MSHHRRAAPGLLLAASALAFPQLAQAATDREADLLARLERVEAELARLRAEVAGARAVQADALTMDAQVATRLATLEARLEPHGFVRVHRGELVRASAVVSLGQRQLTLASGVEVPVSKRLSAAVRAKLKP